MLFVICHDDTALSNESGMNLSPSAASRAKLNILNTMSKIRGQVKTTGYPQAEGLLGDCMLRHGQDLGEDSIFGTNHHIPQTPRWWPCCRTHTGGFLTLSVSAGSPPAGCALTDVGEAMRQVAHVKDSLDLSVKQNFIDPLQHLQDKDLKEITVHKDIHVIPCFKTLPSNSNPFDRV